MPLIDTLALKTDLLGGGMPEPRAAAIVRALVHADTEQLATKADLGVLRADVNTKIEVLRGDLKALNGKANPCLPSIHRRRSPCLRCSGGYSSQDRGRAETRAAALSAGVNSPYCR